MMRPLLVAMPSPTAPSAGTPTSSTGRKIRLKSRTKRAQNLMVAEMLRAIHQHLALATGERNVPSSTSNAIIEHLVYTLAQALLLNADDGSVIREHPRTTAR